MNIDISELDRHLKFLHDEAAYLRTTHTRAVWAQMKAERLDQIAEVLRRLRQEKQMAGIGGARIEG